jgi:predicted ribosomally synthesized peptide with SipW-like signal peptide
MAGTKGEAPMTKNTERARRGRLHKLGLSMLVVGLLGMVAGLGTWSAFSDTTDNSGNAFASGTVDLSDDDSGSAMLSLTNAAPGASDTACINVTYNGSLPAGVRLYGTTGGTGLDQYLDVVVTRGTIASPSFDSCSGFTPDSTTYGYPGTGVIYQGTLQAFADSYGAGVVDPMSGSPETWTNGESHAYRFVVTVQDNNGAQGKNATQTFTWEARNN